MEQALSRDMFERKEGRERKKRYKPEQKRDKPDKPNDLEKLKAKPTAAPLLTHSLARSSEEEEEEVGDQSSDGYKGRVECLH